MNTRERLASVRHSAALAVEAKHTTSGPCRITPTDGVDPADDGGIYRVTADDGAWSGLYRLAYAPARCFLVLVQASDGAPDGVIYVARETWAHVCAYDGRNPGKWP